jgi:hypothetical protein
MIYSQFGALYSEKTLRNGGYIAACLCIQQVFLAQVQKHCAFFYLCKHKIDHNPMRQCDNYSVIVPNLDKPEYRSKQDLRKNDFFINTPLRPSREGIY